jgi:hypothetical protein
MVIRLIIEFLGEDYYCYNVTIKRGAIRINLIIIALIINERENKFNTILLNKVNYIIKGIIIKSYS